MYVKLMEIAKYERISYKNIGLIVIFCISFIVKSPITSSLNTLH
jgi:hypothetical protein